MKKLLVNVTTENQKKTYMIDQSMFGLFNQLLNEYQNSEEAKHNGTNLEDFDTIIDAYTDKLGLCDWEETWLEIKG